MDSIYSDLGEIESLLWDDHDEFKEKTRSKIIAKLNEIRRSLTQTQYPQEHRV